MIARAQVTGFDRDEGNSLRLPEALLNRIKIEANKRDMPYQSLIKAWLSEDVEESRRSR